MTAVATDLFEKPDPKPRPIPNDLSSIITKALREYCVEKWGYYYLPDASLADFREHHADRDNKGRICKYKNWTTALQNWIRWESPSGRFYNSGQWERWIATAKFIEHGERKKPAPVYGPRHIIEKIPRSKILIDIAKDKLRELLK